LEQRDLENLGKPTVHLLLPSEEEPKTLLPHVLHHLAPSPSHDHRRNLSSPTHDQPEQHPKTTINTSTPRQAAALAAASSKHHHPTVQTTIIQPSTTAPTTTVVRRPHVQRCLQPLNNPPLNPATPAVAPPSQLPVAAASASCFTRTYPSTPCHNQLHLPALTNPTPNTTTTTNNNNPSVLNHCPNDSLTP